MRWYLGPSRIEGSLTVPGDKSIGHRGLMLGALANGRSTVRNVPDGQDVSSTARCLVELGVRIERRDGVAEVDGAQALAAPAAALDAGNSGTTIRLLSGILAGHPFTSEITGDASLRRRPMERVAGPLRRMGARVETTDGRPPLHIEGGHLRAIDYRLPVASAQVKSAVLLAGLFADGPTRVEEPAASRDHTERLLDALGVRVRRDGRVTEVWPGRPRPFHLDVPGDPSSAAFFWCAAALHGSHVTVRSVATNPTRIAFLHVLGRMGAAVGVRNERQELGEPRADVTVAGPVLRPVTVEPEEVPALLDELPLVALLATQVQGRSLVRGAGELRVKESDRIEATARGLSLLGARIEGTLDGFLVEGRTELRGSHVDGAGDHRIAMMLAVAGTVAEGKTVVEGADAVAISYPGFAEALAALGGRIDAG